MKRLIFIALLLSSVATLAQQKASLDTRWQMDHGWPMAETQSDGSRIVEMLAKVTPEFRCETLEKQGIRVGAHIGPVVTLRLAPEKVYLLESMKDVLYYQISHEVFPECNEMRADTRVDSVQAGLDLPQGFDGEGVIIGITDWGFDYKHPNYNGGSVENRRILRAWDQFRLAGPAPDGFDYGTELVGYQALKTAQCDTFNIYKYGTHGTHVTGIAAGRGINGTNYTGMAPKASLLMSTFKLGETPWLDAVAWMKRVADEEGKRLVINSSWGMYSISTLDGTSLVSTAINAYSDSGVVFVTSAGNNGDAAFHLGHTFDGEGDTLRSVVRSYTGGPGNMLIMWGTPGMTFEAGVAAEKNGVLVKGPLFSTAAEGYELDSLIVVDGDTARYHIMWEAANALSGRPHMDIKVFQKTGITWHLFITSESGELNAWNLNVQHNNAGNTGYDFESKGLEGYTRGDARYGVSEPGCAEKTITVAAHQSDHFSNVTQQMQTGAIAAFSSHGPIMGGRRKPEISAPGVNVVSSLSSYTTETNLNIVDNAISGGRSYPFGKLSGTSMSSPSVTGIVALILQANPALTTDQVREILFTTARNDSETGDIQASGEMSDIWGWGKVDAYHAVLRALALVGVEEVERSMPPSVFPNPASQWVTLRTGRLEPTYVTVYRTDGSLIWEGTANSEQQLSTAGWGKGIYIVCVQDKKRIATTKLAIR